MASTPTARTNFTAPNFASFLEKYNCYTKCELKNTSVVVDGTNYYYNEYFNNHCKNNDALDLEQFVECVKRGLQKFKDAKVKCYFVMKGGDRVMKDKSQNQHCSSIFKKSIFLQILDAMEIDYAMCEYEVKEDVVALAKKMNCPILSLMLDTWYCFSGVATLFKTFYGQLTNEADKLIYYQFRLDRFMNDYGLRIEHMYSYLGLFMDKPREYRTYPFILMFQEHNITKGNFKMFKWLAARSPSDARNGLMEKLAKTDKNEFLTAEGKVKDILESRQKTFVTKCFLSERFLKITDGDEDWFEKGISMKKIPVAYVNLYRHKQLFGSVEEDSGQEDSMILSLHIVRYAFDLLTNFCGESFESLSVRAMKTEKTVVGVEYSIPRPDYYYSPIGMFTGEPAKFFDHFMSIQLPKLDLKMLESVPKGDQIYMLAAVYVGSRGGCRVTMLGVVGSAAGWRPGCGHSGSLMPSQTLHQFDQCLLELNHLSMLCGDRYQRTDYAARYRSTELRAGAALLQKQRYPIEYVCSQLEGSMRARFNHLIRFYDSCVELENNNSRQYNMGQKY